MISGSAHSRARLPRLLALVAPAALVLGAAPAALAEPAVVGYPNSIAAIGDSITKAYNTEHRPFTDGPAYSWSTGTRGAVQSAYLRILAANPVVREQRANIAKDGAKMSDLLRQAEAAVAGGAEYVTVMLGGNDACRPTEARMTPVARFRAELDAGLRRLSAGLPEARIQVVSVPDVYRLWSLFRGSLVARTVWNVADVCQSLLARPSSNAPPDADRRARVRARTLALNRELRSGCAQFIHCRYDGGAVFSTLFARGDVSSRDYFHPSRTGQAKLATIVWSRTFDFEDAMAPASLATVVPAADGTSVTLNAADDVGLAGIEYRLGGAWLRYRAAVLLPSGQVLEYRAVDVNGNIEASRVVVG